MVWEKKKKRNANIGGFEDNFNEEVTSDWVLKEESSLPGEKQKCRSRKSEKEVRRHGIEEDCDVYAQEM